MHENLIWWFCCLPVFADAEKLRWITKTSLKGNLEKMLESEPGLSLEKALTIFIQQSRDRSDELAVKHLQAYLYKIADKKARSFYYKQSIYKSRVGFLDLKDIYQEGFIIASDPVKFFATYNSGRGKATSYAYDNMGPKIRDRVFQLLGWGDTQVQLVKSKKYRILRNVSEKTLRQALKSSGYANLKLETHFLAWQCFKQVYAPAKREVHNPPTKEQLEQMAELYLLQRKRSPELKQDNSKIDDRFIHQYLESCIDALYQYNYRQSELSLDKNVGGEDSNTTLQETTVDERESRKFEDIEIQDDFTEFCQKLDNKQRKLVFLNYGCGLTTREIAAMDGYKCHYSTVSRQLDSIKELWLYEWYEKNRGDREPGLIKKVMKDPSKKKFVKKLVDDVWKKNESDSYFLIYQAFQKAWQQLESSSQEILELHIRRKPFKNKTPDLSLTPAQEEKIADVFQVLVSRILQSLEAALEMSLASYESLTQKISALVNEFLILNPG